MPKKTSNVFCILSFLFISCLLVNTIRGTLQHQKTFTIKSGLENYQSTVKLDGITCSFKFSTLACSELEKQAAPKKEESSLASYEEVIKRLPKATCLNKVEGYWTYSYCLEGKVKQNHGSEVYQLGSFSK